MLPERGFVLGRTTTTSRQRERGWLRRAVPPGPRRGFMLGRTTIGVSSLGTEEDRGGGSVGEQFWADGRLPN